MRTIKPLGTYNKSYSGIPYSRLQQIALFFLKLLFLIHTSAVYDNSNKDIFLYTSYLNLPTLYSRDSGIISFIQEKDLSKLYQRWWKYDCEQKMSPLFHIIH